MQGDPLSQSQRPVLRQMTELARRVRAPAIGPTMVRLVPLALVPLIVAIDLLVPSDVLWNRLLVAVPALAAASWNPLATGAIGLATLVVDFGLVAYWGRLGQTSAWLTLGVIIAVTLAAMYASHTRRQRERALADILSVAEAAQQALLRPLPRRLGSLRMEALYLAAAARARIGGDFFEAQYTPHGIRLLIGDVRGKGLPAVQVAAVLMGSFREAAHEAPDLPSLANRLETSVQRFSAQVPGTDADERFATALFVEIPEDESVVRLLSCGHPPPLLLSEGTVRVLEAARPSPPLNLAVLLDTHYQVDVSPFGAGDSLLLYTDGVSEGRDRAGVFYPLAERVERHATASPDDLIDRLRTDLLAYTAGTLDDDVAALVVHRAVTPD
ncbi:PP2C family protein-serine/threonine phosphatase [Streptantibioticus ferralitis]